MASETTHRRKGISSKINSEGQLSDSPCTPCVAAKKDCLVHPAYPNCHHCTLKGFASRKCQAGGTGASSSQQACTKQQCAQPQDRAAGINSPLENDGDHMNPSSDRSPKIRRSLYVASLPTTELHTRSPLIPSDGRPLDLTHDNLQSLMGEDPDSYLPRDGQLRGLRDETLSKINSAAETWLGATGYGQPQFIEAVRDPPTFHLLKRIYSIGTRPELICKIAWMNKRYPISLKEALRALIGSAVFEWVFQGHHRAFKSAEDNDQRHRPAEKMRSGFPALLQLQPSDSHPRLLQLLSAISPQLRTQLERKSRYYYVQEDVNVDNHAEELACRISLALTPFDLDNTARWSKKDSDTWLRHLRGVFRAAIRLKLYTCLQPEVFFFRWPQAEEVFDSKWMQCDHENPTDSAYPVYVALFPALLRNDEAMVSDLGQTETAVFSAVVLQKPQ
ncbi:MAG: hypothetical protein Q9209_005042 [Squamulea sp. 1 TL-2023]